MIPVQNKQAVRCGTNSGSVINNLLESIAKISLVINDKGLDYNSRMARILQVILDYLGVDHGSIMVLEKNQLVVKAASRSEIIGYKQPLTEDSISSWVGKSGEPLFIKDIFASRFRSSSPGIYRDTSLLSVPIMRDAKVMGVINVTDKGANKHLIKDDIACLLRFSSLILSLLAQQNLQEKLKKQRNTLRRKNKELKRQESFREDLSRMLIHDLKGYLSEVVANLDILSFSIPEASKEFLEAAQIACDRGVRMVSNLVTVGRIEDGKIQLILEDIPPGDLIIESVNSVRGLAKLKNVVLKIDIEENIPTLRLDRILILRVLQNLLNNSLACTESGKKIIIGSRLLPGGKAVEFFVQDQGAGIPQEKLAMIFDKYASLACSGNGGVGTGLGLYFCKLAVEEHDGKIGVESAVAEGSRFHFSLPV